MRQIKGVQLMALILLFILPVRAEKVSLDQAKKVAQNQGVHLLGTLWNQSLYYNDLCPMDLATIYKTIHIV